MPPQPDWNQQLWAGIYARIADSVARLETLASLASWEKAGHRAAAQAYRQSTHEEALWVVGILTGQIRVLQG